MTLQIKPEINKVPIKTLKTFIKQLLSERGKILTHKFKKQWKTLHIRIYEMYLELWSEEEQRPISQMNIIQKQ